MAAGVDKIRLTGGEPTVRRDLVPISAQLAALPGLRTLAMTTNGIALTRQLPALRAAGLAALNISLDTLREERYVELTRRQGAARVRAAIEAAAAQGFSVKVNVVVMRGKNDDEILDFVELVRGRPVNVRFIEYMPFDDNEWATNKMVRCWQFLRCSLCVVLQVCCSADKGAWTTLTSLSRFSRAQARRRALVPA